MMTTETAAPSRVRRGMRSLHRRASRAWRLARATVVDTRTTPERLARALDVAPAALDERIRDLRKALAHRLPSGPGDAGAIRLALRVGAPDQLEALGATADRALSRTVDLLGSGPVQLGCPIDWHRDFKSGRRWPADRHHVRIAFDDVPGADVKVPWELSRGQHLPSLAQAALLLENDACAREAAAQIREWMAANRPEYGVNWTCAMDVALRAVNWIWTAGLLARHEAVDDAFFAELTASLADHGAFIEANLEDPPDGIRTNHYLADLLGLLYIGACLPELPRAPAWRTFARAALAREIESQVLPDGASFESSIPYHRLAAEIFLSAAALERHLGAPFDASYLSRLASMIEFTAAYTKPNGCAPQVGDADDGRVHILSRQDADHRDHRHLLAAGAVMFDREDWWRASGSAWTEGLWLGGARDPRWQTPASKEPTPVHGRSFPDAGVHILRHGSDFVMLTAGRVGTSGLGNHKHNDLLAIEVHLGGEDVLVDPGTYLYTPDPAARNAFRSTAAHNTVVIDGVEQNEIPAAVLFALGTNAVPSRLEWEIRDGESRVTAEHDGYRRLPDAVTHRRSVVLSASGVVKVDDRFIATAFAPHRLVWTFAFAPRSVVDAAARGWRVTLLSGRAVFLSRPSTADSARLDVAATVTTGFVSPSYGVRLAAPLLRWEWTGPLPSSVCFTIAADEDITCAAS